MRDRCQTAGYDDALDKTQQAIVASTHLQYHRKADGPGLSHCICPIAYKVSTSSSLTKGCLILTTRARKHFDASLALACKPDLNYDIKGLALCVCVCVLIGPVRILFIL